MTSTRIIQLLLLFPVCVMLSSCAGVNETRLQNGYFLRKENIGNNVNRLSLWRETKDRRRLVCETISENGQILSLLPTPYSYGCVVRFHSDFKKIKLNPLQQVTLTSAPEE